MYAKLILPSLLHFRQNVPNINRFLSSDFFSSLVVKKFSFIQRKNKSLVFDDTKVRTLPVSSATYFSTTSFCLCNKYLDETLNELYDKEYEKLLDSTFKTSESSHQVFLIQPYIKWGNKKKTLTTPDLQLDESISLIRTLPQWKVVGSKIISLMSFDRPTIFGKGNMEFLKEIITSNKNVTAVFVSLNMLRPDQDRELEEAFKVPVFDRYKIVVEIFKLHATTREAKLQVALGQIPYLWSRLKYDRDDISDKMGGGATVGGPGETYLEIKKRLLQDKERKIKNEISKLNTQRELLRSKRKELQLPIVAVVGYTNSGKTSIIKALTKEENLMPKDVLFATLDVTVHAGSMPSGLKVLFVDTVGFLSDIPTSLIQAFMATLEDAVQADLILHVQDISNPDLKAQNEHVLKTLKSFNLPGQLLDTMVTVANKVDLVSGNAPDIGTALPVSSMTGVGMNNLIMHLESCLIKSTGQIFIKIRVPNGGDEYRWLHKEATVTKVIADEQNNQFAFVNTLITEAKLNKFKHMFIKSKVKR